MKRGNFIKKVTQLLGLKDFQSRESDEKSIKVLLKKLAKRKHKIARNIKKETSKREREDLLEELEIVQMQIEKGTKILKAFKK